MRLAAAAAEFDNDGAWSVGREIDGRIHANAEIAPRVITFSSVKLDFFDADRLVQRETEMGGQRLCHDKVIGVSAASERHILNTRPSVAKLSSDREKQGKHGAAVPSTGQVRLHGDGWIEQ